MVCTVSFQEVAYHQRVQHWTAVLCSGGLGQYRETLFEVGSDWLTQTSFEQSYCGAILENKRMVCYPNVLMHGKYGHGVFAAEGPICPLNECLVCFLADLAINNIVLLR